MGTTEIIVTVIAALIPVLLASLAWFFFIGNLTERTGNLEKETKTLRTSAGNLQNEVTRVKTIVDESRPSLSTIQSSVQSLQNESTSVRTKLDYLSPTVSQLESRVTELQREIAELKGVARREEST